MEETNADLEDSFDSRYVVPGLSRGLSLLQLFTPAVSDLKLTEIAHSMGLSRSAAYRLVYTLVRDGFLKRDARTLRYRLTPRVLSLGFSYLHSEPLTKVAQPVLDDLGRSTRIAAHLVILDGWECVYIAGGAPDTAVISNLQIGARFPAHVVASGRVLLAHKGRDALQRVFEALTRECHVVPPPKSVGSLIAAARSDKARGYVYGHAVFDPVVVSLACPVLDVSGTAVASINVVGLKELIEVQGGAEKLSHKVATAAAVLSNRLGFRDS